MLQRSTFLSAGLLSLSLFAAQNPVIATDPAPDKDNPAAMRSFRLPSHDALLNAFVYVAAGAGPHPNVILLHGFPGNERNLDLAQSIRRAGWNVLYFDYRGSWGSPGDSFTHCIEDAQSAIGYLRDTTMAAKLRSDPQSIVLIGHSMGGFVALQAGSLDPGIRTIVTISAADLETSRVQIARPTSMISLSAVSPPDSQRRHGAARRHHPSEPRQRSSRQRQPGGTS
jgi:pimeloyl-ACP methyl ester carboxylesterase